MNNEERLRLYKKSLESAWGYNDYNDWPIKFNSIMHLFLKEFTEEFLINLDKLQKRGISLKQIAQQFGNPARLYRIINPIIYGMRCMHIPLKKQREIVLTILDMMTYLKSGSVFNETEVNWILSHDECNDLLSYKQFHAAEKENVALLQRFCGVAWAYTEALFFRAHDVTKEIHGLYPIDGSTDRLLIREYMHLNCKDIWKHENSFPYNTIKVYTRYSEQFDLAIDAYNHLFHRSGNASENMVSYRVEADGEEIQLSSLSEIINMMVNTINKIHQQIDRADWRFKAVKYAEIYWYRKKPLSDMLGIDWRIPDKIYHNIATGKPDERRLRNLTENEIRRLIYTII